MGLEPRPSKDTSLCVEEEFLGPLRVKLVDKGDLGNHKE